MCEINILKDAYNIVFEKPINFESFYDRLQLQKMVYFLQEFGVSCGSYNYIWFKHGPYSHKLQMEINKHRQDPNSSTENLNLELSECALSALEKLQNYAFDPLGRYRSDEWLALLASLHFYKKYICPYESNEYILKKVRERKAKEGDDRFFCEDSNFEALKVLEIFENN